MRKYSLGVVGTGRVGTALGVALARSGYHLVGASARSEEARARASRLLPRTPLFSPSALAKRCDILLLTVPDDAIAPVCDQLADAGDLRGGQYVVHTSGARGLACLRGAAEVGAVPLAIHPAMTFPGLDDDADNLAGLAYAVTSPPEERANAEQLVRDLDGVPVWIPETNRTLYHAALVLGANNLITLTSAAMQALDAAGIANPALVLGPLVRASLENALRLGDQALTGPVRRADTGTIQAHLTALRDRAPSLVSGYLQFALVTAQRAREADLTTAEEIDRVVTTLRREMTTGGTTTPT